MKPIGILYATRNGHTRRIAEHIASDLRARGLPVELNNVGDADTAIHPSHYSAAVLAASVHMGAHERIFVTNHDNPVADAVRVPLEILMPAQAEVEHFRHDARR